VREEEKKRQSVKDRKEGSEMIGVIRLTSDVHKVVIAIDLYFQQL